MMYRGVNYTPMMKNVQLHFKTLCSFHFIKEEAFRLDHSSSGLTMGILLACQGDNL